MTDDESEWAVPIAIAAVLWAALSQCTEAQEQPMTVRDLTLNEARAAALSEPHDQVSCYQERQRGITHVCITETEWMRQHEDDNGEKTQALLPAVAGAD